MLFDFSLVLSVMMKNCGMNTHQPKRRQGMYIVAVAVSTGRETRQRSLLLSFFADHELRRNNIVGA
jgi:hypothetical protein